MYWETLPNWFWAIYYLLFAITLGMALFSVVKRKIKGLSIVAMVFTLTVPIVSLLNSIGRAEGMNEFEHLMSQLQRGATWSVFVMIGYLFLFGWWVLFLIKDNHKKWWLIKREGIK